MLQKVKLFFSRISQQKRWKKQEKQSSQKINICKLCFNKIEENSIHSFLVDKPSICYRCFKESKPKITHFEINGCNAIALYDYDDIIKQRLYQFKGCYDFELKNTFLEYFVFYLKFHYFGYVIVPAPSSEKSNQERGFNHVEEMYKILGLKMVKCIHKTYDIKQADLSSKDRMKISSFLKMDSNIHLTNKKVLIVDDVLTTGSTVKAMINLIKKCNPKLIKVLVLSRTVFEPEK